MTTTTTGTQDDTQAQNTAQGGPAPAEGTKGAGDATGTPTGRPAPATGAQGTDDGTQDGSKAGREAARYRTRLREAEAERDGLAERVATLQRREVERVAAEQLAAPGDLFDIGAAELADLLTEDGVPDPERVNEAVAALLESRPGLAKVAPPGWPDMGQGKRGSASPAGTTWEKVLKGK